MIFVDNQNINDPSVNLALEEYLLRNLPAGEEYLLFYINEPSIIIGRNQNTIEEINTTYVEANHIHVVRRLSGGGAVYHDLGNLNFSFITAYQEEVFSNFEKFTRPVINVLREMGVPAELSGRNDIVVDGHKISGNAQYISRGRMVSHGTLLLNSDLDRVGEALRVKASKISSKGIKSVRSRVANICEYLPEPLDILEFRRRIIAGVFAGASPVPEYPVSPEDWQAVTALANERYRAWDWNYGQSPAFNIQKVKRYPAGEIDARIEVDGGMIRGIRFFGDFFGRQEVSELERALVGTRYEPTALYQALGRFDLTNYFVGMTLDELVTLLY